MNLKITLPRIPTRLAKAFDAWLLWINADVWKSVRRLDVLLVVLGVLCGAYYYQEGGWLLAAQGVALYTFVALASIWMF
jgi:hypothetical protein